MYLQPGLAHKRGLDFLRRPRGILLHNVSMSQCPAKPLLARYQSSLVDTTPFGSEPALPVSAESQADADDAALFGLLWPLGEVVKLDATVKRRVLRQ